MTGFYASFGARHSVRDLSKLLAPLGVIPSQCWKSGDERRTPNGLRLDGSYGESYVSYVLPLAESDDLAVWLENAVTFLRPASKELLAFVSDGGSLSMYIGLEKGVFEGVVLSPKLLTELASLSISLEIDRNL
jgi:hypothetical protein